ncbi:ankyrin repeat domain-containing protein [Cardinium endosymbiont of Sogatella furcifera]|uniref:ankyrin repeat domain-containing protein n=1 Tax=Cardinium endosymbiont of Sogatella furcifera TaxID=650378 RepID=UPI0013B382DF|nr:ankyrin repeat domain-containing protein [Cardinium endosymbiont of Sogatella furcifera]
MVQLFKKNDHTLSGNLKKPNAKKGKTTRAEAPYPYPLHKVVCENDYKAVAAILKADKQQYSRASDRRVNQQDIQQYFPIHWAVSKKFSYKSGNEAKNNIAILKLLLHHYQSNQVDKDNKTILHWAVYNEHLNGVKVILEFLSKKFSNVIHQHDNNGLTALHYAVDFNEQGKYSAKQLEILQEILQYSGRHINTTDRNGMTVLHWAVANNNQNAVEAVVNYAKRILPQAAAKTFIQRKTAINPKTGIGACTAIYWTVNPEHSEENEESTRETSLQIFQFLLPEYNINDQDNQGNTLAQWAAVLGRKDILKVLIAQDADLTIQDKRGRTVLHATLEAIDNARAKQEQAIKTQDFKEMQKICTLIKSLTHQSIVSPSNPKTLVIVQYHTGEDDSILTQLLSLPHARAGLYKSDIKGLTPPNLERKYKLFQEPIAAANQKTSRVKTKKRPYDDRQSNTNMIPFKKRIIQ